MNKKKLEIKKIIRTITIIVVLIALLFVFSIISDSRPHTVPNTNNNQVEELTNTEIILKLSNNTHEDLVNYKDLITITDKVYLITEENKAELQENYFFTFSESIVVDYGFMLAEVGDYILEFGNLVVVYNYQDDTVKSLFQVQGLNS